MTQSLLTIIAPPAMEDSLVDWLLDQETLIGFTSCEVYGHGSRSSGMSLLEQVTGRQRRVQFMVHAETEMAAGLLAQLKARFSGTGLHYLLQPISDAGQL